MRAFGGIKFERGVACMIEVNQFNLMGSWLEVESTKPIVWSVQRIIFDDCFSIDQQPVAIVAVDAERPYASLILGHSESCFGTDCEVVIISTRECKVGSKPPHRASFDIREIDLMQISRRKQIINVAQVENTLVRNQLLDGKTCRRHTQSWRHRGRNQAEV